MRPGFTATVTALTLAGVFAAAAPALAQSPQSQDTAGTAAGTAAVSQSSAKETETARTLALKWAHRARKNRRHALRHARVLRERLPRRFRTPILRPRDTAPGRLSAQDWSDYGAACRSRAKALARYVRTTWRRIRHPRGHSVSRWLPLLRHEGWPAATHAMCLRVIRRESGGDPNLIGSGGYYGLFQMSWSFSRGRFDLRNPVVNVKLALQLYKRRGWQPWASTAY